MEQVTTAAFYHDPAFWTVIVSFIAVILSQIPPIHILFRKAKIDFELFSNILLSHKIGNPNLEANLFISNIGGRKVRIKKIEASIERDGTHVITLPAKNYFQNPDDQNSTMLTTFSLSPNEEWSHNLTFLNFFNREEEQEYQRIEADMRSDYAEQTREQEEDPKNLIEHPKEQVERALNFFEKKFMWEPGDYKLTLNIETDRTSANISKTFNFILFESKSDQLKEITKRYHHGAGIWWTPDIKSGFATFVEITEI